MKNKKNWHIIWQIHCAICCIRYSTIQFVLPFAMHFSSQRSLHYEHFMNKFAIVSSCFAILTEFRYRHQCTIILSHTQWARSNSLERKSQRNEFLISSPSERTKWENTHTHAHTFSNVDLAVYCNSNVEYVNCVQCARAPCSSQCDTHHCASDSVRGIEGVFEYVLKRTVKSIAKWYR